MEYRDYKGINCLNYLKIDCSKCFGLCCVALYFSKMDGFPKDKVSGQPCPNLNDIKKKDFTCKIHKDLLKRNLKGCVSYDCFGAGQKVAKHIYKDISWKDKKNNSDEMYGVFNRVREIHEMIWYLVDSLTFTKNEKLIKDIKEMIKSSENLTNLTPKEILNLNVNSHQDKVNILLKEVRKEVIKKACPKDKKDLPLGFDFMGKDLRKTNLRNKNLAGALLIKSDMRNCDLSGAMLIGADMRDADIRGANLEDTMYINQHQINSAIGDSKTKLPRYIERPSYWN